MSKNNEADLKGKSSEKNGTKEQKDIINIYIDVTDIVEIYTKVVVLQYQVGLTVQPSRFLTAANKLLCTNWSTVVRSWNTMSPSLGAAEAAWLFARQSHDKAFPFLKKSFAAAKK